MTKEKTAGVSSAREGQGERTAGERRHLGLKGSPNFRDAGGYATQDGSALHWGRLFRSGHLANLHEEDALRLRELGIDLVCDLRRDDERAAEPSQLPPGVEVFNASITPGSQNSAIYSDSTRIGGAGGMAEFMCAINREFVLSQTGVYREVFGQLLDRGAQRVLFHCSAGKDRTGFAVAALQLALGVARGDVEADYLLSRHYYRPQEQLERVRAKYRVEHLSDEDLLPMLLTRLDYLHNALDAMEHSHGSVERYLEKGLGIGGSEQRELRRRFVAK